MIGTLIWLAGLLLAIKACLDIWKADGDQAKKILVIVLILLTSWLGLAFYYFYAKNHLDKFIK